MNQTYQLPPEFLFSLNAALIKQQISSMDFLTPCLWNCQMSYQDPENLAQLVTNDGLFYTSSDLQRLPAFQPTPPLLPIQNLNSQANHSFLIQQSNQEKVEVQNFQALRATIQQENQRRVQVPIMNEFMSTSNQSLPRQQRREEQKVAPVHNGELIQQSHQERKINGIPQKPLSTILLEVSFRNQMLEKLFNAHFKEFYRQDEIYKKIIRRLVRAKRIKFKRFVVSQEGHQVYDNERAERLLLQFLNVEYGMALPIGYEELEFAKSTVYTFGAKTREASTLLQQRYRVRELRNQFLEKGTQKEAEKFFRSEVGFKLFYHDFAALLIFGNQRCNHHNNWKVIYGFKKLMKRLLGHHCFKEMLQATVDNIYVYQETFPEAYANSF